MAIGLQLEQVANLLFSKARPATLIHFVTERCNARCPFCFVDFRPSTDRADELSLQEIAQITKNLPRSLMNVNISGGEPFIRNDLTDIADLYLTNSSAQSLFISTNGFYTSNIVRFCETMPDRHPEKTIFLSLSINQIGKKHDLLTAVDGMFERCIATFSAIKAFRPAIIPSVSLTISPQNYRESLKIYDHLVNEQKIDAIQIVMARSEGVYNVPSDERMGMAVAYEELTRKILRDCQKGLLHEYGNDSFRGRILNDKNILSRELVVSHIRGERPFRHCQAGSLFGVITADGTVYPCEILDKPFGNLRQASYDIKKLWEGERAMEIRQWLKTTKCACTYECAISVNILSNWTFYLQHMTGYLR